MDAQTFMRLAGSPDSLDGLLSLLDAVFGIGLFALAWFISFRFFALVGEVMRLSREKELARKRYEEGIDRDIAHFTDYE